MKVITYVHSAIKDDTTLTAEMRCYITISFTSAAESLLKYGSYLP